MFSTSKQPTTKSANFQIGILSPLQDLVTTFFTNISAHFSLRKLESLTTAIVETKELNNVVLTSVSLDKLNLNYNLSQNEQQPIIDNAKSVIQQSLKEVDALVILLPENNVEAVLTLINSNLITYCATLIRDKIPYVQPCSFYICNEDKQTEEFLTTNDSTFLWNNNKDIIVNKRCCTASNKVPNELISMLEAIISGKRFDSNTMQSHFTLLCNSALYCYKNRQRCAVKIRTSKWEKLLGNTKGTKAVDIVKKQLTKRKISFGDFASVLHTAVTLQLDKCVSYLLNCSLQHSIEKRTSLAFYSLLKQQNDIIDKNNNLLVQFNNIQFRSSLCTGFKAIFDNYSINELCINEDGNTPLHSAATVENNAIITLLLNKQADWSYKNNKGLIASNIATQPAVKQLLESGVEDSMKALLRSIHSTDTKAQRKQYADKLKSLTATIANRKIMVQLLWKEAKWGNISLHNEIKQKELIVKQTIGSGSFGKVCSGEWQGLDVAIKYIDENNPLFDLEAFRCERAVLGLLSHPNIISIYGAGRYSERSVHGPRASGFFLVMPLASCALSNLVHGNSDEKCPLKYEDFNMLQVMTDVAKGLAYLHEHKIIHRDIKPENILITTDKTPLLADMGIARADFGGTVAKTVIGTSRYMAPELYSGRVAANYSFAVDVFSFGVTLWEVLTRTVPPLVSIGNEPLPMNKHWPLELRSLLVDCLIVGAPAKRPTFDAIVARLQSIPAIPQAAPSVALQSGSALEGSMVTDMFAMMQVVQEADVADYFRALNTEQRNTLKVQCERYLELLSEAEALSLTAQAANNNNSSIDITTSEESTFSFATNFSGETTAGLSSCNVFLLGSSYNDRQRVMRAFTDNTSATMPDVVYNIAASGTNSYELSLNVHNFKYQQLGSPTGSLLLGKIGLFILVIRFSADLSEQKIWDQVAQLRHYIVKPSNILIVLLVDDIYVKEMRSRVDTIMQQVREARNRLSSKGKKSYVIPLSLSNNAKLNRLYGASKFITFSHNIACCTVSEFVVPISWIHFNGWVTKQLQVKYTAMATQLETGDTINAVYSWNNCLEIAERHGIDTTEFSSAISFLQKAGIIAAVVQSKWIIVDRVWLNFIASAIATSSSVVMPNGICTLDRLQSVLNMASLLPGNNVAILGCIVEVLEQHEVFLKVNNDTTTIIQYTGSSMIPTTAIVTSNITPYVACNFFKRYNPNYTIINRELFHLFSSVYPPTLPNDELELTRRIDIDANYDNFNAITQIVEIIKDLKDVIISFCWSRYLVFNYKGATINMFHLSPFDTFYLQAVVRIKKTSLQLIGADTVQLVTIIFAQVLESCSLFNKFPATTFMRFKLEARKVNNDNDTSMLKHSNDAIEPSVISPPTNKVSGDGTIHESPTTSTTSTTSTFLFREKHVYSLNEVIFVFLKDCNCINYNYIPILAPEILFCDEIQHLQPIQTSNDNTAAVTNKETKDTSIPTELDNCKVDHVIYNVKDTSLVSNYFGHNMKSYILRFAANKKVFLAPIGKLTRREEVIYFYKQTVPLNIKIQQLRLSVKQKIKILIDVATILIELHQLPIPVLYANLNMSAVNVFSKADFINDISAVLVNFQYSKLCTNSLSTTTPMQADTIYNWKQVAPEAIDNQYYKVCLKSDIFSFGIFCFELFTESAAYDHIKDNPKYWSDNCTNEVTTTSISNSTIEDNIIVKKVKKDIVSTAALRPSYTAKTNSNSPLVPQEIVALSQQCWIAAPQERPSLEHILSILTSL